MIERSSSNDKREASVKTSTDTTIQNRESYFPPSSRHVRFILPEDNPTQKTKSPRTKATLASFDSSTLASLQSVMSPILVERDPSTLPSFYDSPSSILHASFPKVPIELSQGLPRDSNTRSSSLFARRLEALAREKSATEIAADFGVAKVNLQPDAPVSIISEAAASSKAGESVERINTLSLVSSLAPGTIGSEVLGASEMDSIHAENVARLAALDPSDVERERRELLAQIDPQLVAFLRGRRAHAQSTQSQAPPTVAAPAAAADEHATRAKKAKQEPAVTRETGSHSDSDSECEHESESMPPVVDHRTTRASAEKPVRRPASHTPHSESVPSTRAAAGKSLRAGHSVASTSTLSSSAALGSGGSPSATQLAHEAHALGWLHMDRLEAEKLRWTESVAARGGGGGGGGGSGGDGGGERRHFEASAATRELRARFDLRGLVVPVPQPQSDSQAEADADAPAADRALFHHADEPEVVSSQYSSHSTTLRAQYYMRTSRRGRVTRSRSSTCCVAARTRSSECSRSPRSPTSFATYTDSTSYTRTVHVILERLPRANSRLLDTVELVRTGSTRRAARRAARAAAAAAARALVRRRARVPRAARARRRARRHALRRDRLAPRGARVRARRGACFCLSPGPSLCSARVLSYEL